MKAWVSCKKKGSGGIRCIDCGAVTTTYVREWHKKVYDTAVWNAVSQIPSVCPSCGSANIEPDSVRADLGGYEDKLPSAYQTHSKADTHWFAVRIAGASSDVNNAKSASGVTELTDEQARDEIKKYNPNADLISYNVSDSEIDDLMSSQSMRRETENLKHMANKLGISIDEAKTDNENYKKIVSAAGKQGIDMDIIQDGLQDQEANCMKKVADAKGVDISAKLDDIKNGKSKAHEDAMKKIRGTAKTVGVLFQDPPDDRDYKASERLTAKKADLPDSVSYHDQMTPVKSQQNLGSCVSFSTIAVREVLEAIYRPWRLPLEDLSELDHYKNTKELDPWDDSQGTCFRYALKVLQKQGVCPEKACPYEDVFPPRKPTAWWGQGLKRWDKITSYHRLDRIDEMKRWLYEQSPFVIGIPLTSSFFYPDENGMIPVPSSSERVIGGHGLCVCGYSDKKQAFLFKNSWSTDWGLEGYAWLPYKYLVWCDWFDTWGFLVE